MLTPADTVTVYAAQGGTYRAVVADMQRPPSLGIANHWLACYVMISRAQSIDGFLVLRPATRKDLSSRPPQYLLDELDRLLQLERSSHEELQRYLESLPLDLPAEIVNLLRVESAMEQEQLVQSIRAREVRLHQGRVLKDLFPPVRVMPPS